MLFLMGISQTNFNMASFLTSADKLAENSSPHEKKSGAAIDGRFSALLEHTGAPVHTKPGLKAKKTDTMAHDVPLGDPDDSGAMVAAKKPSGKNATPAAEKKRQPGPNGPHTDHPHTAEPDLKGFEVAKLSAPLKPLAKGSIIGPSGKSATSAHLMRLAEANPPNTNIPGDSTAADRLEEKTASDLSRHQGNAWLDLNAPKTSTNATGDGKTETTGFKRKILTSDPGLEKGGHKAAKKKAPEDTNLAVSANDPSSPAVKTAAPHGTHDPRAATTAPADPASALKANGYASADTSDSKSVPPETPALSNDTSSLQRATEIRIKLPSASDGLHAGVMPVVAMRVTTKENGARTLEVRLDPAELGKIDVKLETAEDGRIRAVFQAENPAAFELLKREGTALENALRDVGVNLADNALSFSLSGGGSGPAHHFSGDGFRSDHGRAFVSLANEPEGSTTTITWPSGLIDISI